MSKKAILIEDNPLIRGSDSHLISPYSITNESNIKVTRFEEMIFILRCPWLLNQFSIGNV